MRKLYISILICFSIFTVSVSYAACVDLKVLTFNIRNANADDGDNAWNQGRDQRALNLILRLRPDIVGVQEAVHGIYGDQVGDLSHLVGYTWSGVGRDDGVDAGEFEGILYRTKRFSLIKSGQFWISDTPEVPHTTFASQFMNPAWDSENSRMASWVILQDRRNAQQYFILNQHWALPAETQPKSANLIRQQLHKLNPKKLPVILFGDFNMTDQNPQEPGSMNSKNAYKLMVDGNPQELGQYQGILTDVYRAIYDVKTQFEMTYHAFHGGELYFDKTHPEFNHRMDFIFTSKDFKPIYAEIVHDNLIPGIGLFVSDHYPVFAKLEYTDNTDILR